MIAPCGWRELKNKINTMQILKQIDEEFKISFFGSESNPDNEVMD